MAPVRLCQNHQAALCIVQRSQDYLVQAIHPIKKVAKVASTSQHPREEIGDDQSVPGLARSFWSARSTPDQREIPWLSVHH